MSLGNTSIHQRGEIPEITKLPNGRIRVVRRFQKFTREDIDNENLGSLMGDFGDLDTAGEQVANQGYTNCRLISVEVDSGYSSASSTDQPVLVKTYETLTDSFVQITDDTVDFTENGLKKITRVYRATSGTTSSNVVGVTALGTGEILASSRIEDNDAFAELTETYVEAGIISETTRPAPSAFAGAVEITRISTGVASVPDGVLINSVDENAGGYSTFTRVTLKSLGENADDLTGVTSQYKDLVEVSTAGVVTLTNVTVLEGTVAIPKHTPPRVKQVSCNVITEIVTTLPDTAPSDIAFNLEDLSCAVTTTKSSVTNSSGNTVSSTSGIFTFSATGFNKSVSNSARIQVYDGSYYTGTGSGNVSYVSFESPYINESGGISYETGNASEQTKCIGAGANSLPSSYKTHGLVSRNAKHILTALNGVKYFEVTSFVIPNPDPADPAP
jgi:hypothetical protein